MTVSNMSNPWSDVYKNLREPYLQEKMAKKDYDGDGKIESGKDEYMGSRDKAIKKAMGKDPKKDMKKEDVEQVDEINAGYSTDSGGTSKNTIRSTFTKQGKPRTKAQMMAANRIASGQTISQVNTANKMSMRDRARARFAAFKAKRAKFRANRMEHHQKDADGKVIEHGNGTPSPVNEMITLTKGDYGSRNVVGSAYNTAKKKKFDPKIYKAGGGLGANFLPLVNSYEPAKVAKPNFSNWREDFIFTDEVEEAVKRPKLDIKEKGVDNKIELNPDDGLKESKKKI